MDSGKCHKNPNVAFAQGAQANKFSLRCIV